jgi:Cof subfamily protein (haloacid dehalogenase superfamily)
VKYRLLVLDIDGTLLGKETNVSDENKLALKRAIQSGVTVSLCTGRTPRAARSVLNQLMLDGYHTFFDGALVIDPQNEHEIYVQPIEIDIIRQAIKWAHNNQHDIELYSETQYFAERENWSTRVHEEFFNVKAELGDYENFLGKESIVKIGTVSTNPDESLKVSEFQKAFINKLNFTRVRTPAYPGIDFINVVSPLVSKGTAVSRLAAHLHISKEEIAAIGDGSNDISLLSSVGLAIAMPHSPDELISVADHITLDVEDNGVAAAVNRFILSE